ncbi:MAG: hypothetical protein MJY62_00200 [Bacteroidales bacterium]|nr:hypothetical protein [Bacteroidales bacterium]
MRIKHLVPAILLSVLAVLSVSCNKEQAQLSAEFNVDKSSVTFEVAGGSETIKLDANMAWKLKGYTDEVKAWLSISPTEGSGNATITVTATENVGANREVTISFYGDKLNQASVKFTQAGPKGDAELLTVAEFIAKAETATDYKLQGKISNISPSSKTYYGFDLTDETGTIACAFPKNFKEKEANLAQNCVVTIKGHYEYYESKKTHQMADGVIENIEAPVKTDAVKGTVKEFLDAKNPTVLYELKGTAEGFDSKYCSFTLNDGTGKVKIYSVDAASKETYGSKIKNGSFVTLQGYYKDYQGTAEIDPATIISVDDGEPIDLTPYEQAAEKTVSEIVASKDSSTFYKYKGTVSKYVKTNGRFELTDATGTIPVFEVMNKDRFEMKDGGTVTIAGTYSFYRPENKSELVGVYLLAYDASTEKPVEQLAHPLTSEIKWTLGASASDSTSTGTSKQSAVVNEVPVKNLLKMGTSSKAGSATLHIPVGVTEIGFYSACWNGLESADIKIGGKTVTVPTNAGLTGDPAFNLTFSDAANYFTVAVTPGSDVTVTCDKRVVLIGVNPTKIVESKLSVSKTEVELPIEGTATEIQLTSTLAWTLKGYDDVKSWLTISPESAAGSSNISISATKNDGVKREAKITFYADDDNQAIVTITQLGSKNEDYLAHPLTSSIKWTIGSNSQEGSGTINKQKVEKLIKLSTSSKAGSATLTIPAGVTKIGFYAVCWNDLAGGADLSVGGKTVHISPNANFKGNSPYTLQITDADYYTVEVTPGSVEVKCDKRAALIGINPVEE